MEATNENAHLRGKLAASIAAYEAQRQFSQDNLAEALRRVSELERKLSWDDFAECDDCAAVASEAMCPEHLAAHNARVRREALDLAWNEVDAIRRTAAALRDQAKAAKREYVADCRQSDIETCERVESSIRALIEKP